jgi:hypothetical protein
MKIFVCPRCEAPNSESDFPLIGINQRIIGLDNSKTDVPFGKSAHRRRRDPKIFDPWDSPEYLGCCQEGADPHYCCPRFGKHANRFSPATLEKLAVVKEARENRWGLEFHSKGRRPVDEVCLSLGRPYEGPMRYDIDTSGLYQQNKRLFGQLRYGGLPL